MNKLTYVHILIIGIVVALIVAAAMYWFMLKPKKEDTEQTNSTAATTEQNGGTQQMIDQKVKELAKTKEDAKQTELKWNVNVVKYMPNLPYTDKTNAMELYFEPIVGRTGQGKMVGFRDIPTVWGQWITAWYDAQKNLGVERLPGVEFPIAEFDTDPNKLPATLANHLTFPSDTKPWPVQLKCKDFDSAISHLKRFNNMERHGMPVINNITISGPGANPGSTDIILSYDLFLYIIPRSGPPVADQMINAGGGAAAPGAPGLGGPSFGAMGGGGKGAGKAD